MQLPKYAVFVLWNAPYPVPRLTLAGRSGGPLAEVPLSPFFFRPPPYKFSSSWILAVEDVDQLAGEDVD